MRKALVKALMDRADDPNFVFLTGDLGYKALEPLRDKMGERFINAGVAEQNMVTVAAGLAACDNIPWCYSIAPFLYARAFEQIRNDVCQANRAVMLVGNGAGYAYGVMGPSHHALNDYGALLTLPNIRCLIPAFASDIPAMVAKMFTSYSSRATYLRLGVAEEPADYVPPAYYAPWRQLSYVVDAPTVIVVGSIVGSYLPDLLDICNLWVVSELPSLLPMDDIDAYGNVLIVEEHVEHGSFGAAAIGKLSSELCTVEHRFARGYPSGTYGSKEFHRKESLLDKDSIVQWIRTCAS
jgi:transketolase